jgi:hypothetical protein
MSSETKRRFRSRPGVTGSPDRGWERTVPRTPRQGRVGGEIAGFDTFLTRAKRHEASRWEDRLTAAAGVEAPQPLMTTGVRGGA